MNWSLTQQDLAREAQGSEAPQEDGVKETAQDRVYRQISHLLLCGYFRPGETVSLRQLSSALEVSETPVRTALNRLVADRAIDVLPNRYFCVPALSEEEFAELVELRLLLEVDLVRYAYRLASRQDIRELERINEDFLSARHKVQQQATLEANQRFHFKLYAVAQRPMTTELVRSVWLRAGSIIGMALRVGGARWSDDLHVSIIRGLKIRDEDLCVGALQEDVRHSFDLIKGLDGIKLFRTTL